MTYPVPRRHSHCRSRITVRWKLPRGLSICDRPCRNRNEFTSELLVRSAKCMNSIPSLSFWVSL